VWLLKYVDDIECWTLLAADDGLSVHQRSAAVHCLACHFTRCLWLFGFVLCSLISGVCQCTLTWHVAYYTHTHTHNCFTAVVQVVLYYQAPLFKNWTIPYCVIYYYYNRFNCQFCLGLPGWASTKRNIDPLTYSDHHPTFISFFCLLRSIASSLFNLHAWQSFCTTSPSPLWSTSWSGALHLILHTYISSPNQCLLFATHARTIATCFAVVPRLSSVPSLSLNSLLGPLSFTLTSHIHLIILISACWSAT